MSDQCCKINRWQQRWANEQSYVGPMSFANVEPMLLTTMGQRWANVSMLSGLVPPSTTFSAIAGDISSDEDTHVPHSSRADTTPQPPPPPDIPVAISEPPVASPVDDHDSCEDSAIELPGVTTNQSSPLRRSTRQRRGFCIRLVI